MSEFWGALVILIVCPLLGALPLIAWITKALTRRQLAQIGTGNISVSAAFYHGGTLVGVLAVLSEALKGIAVVYLARVFFISGSPWELIALIALVIGRYAVGKGAGTTNVAWGFAVHDPLAAGFVFLLAIVCFTIIRNRQIAKYGVLVLFPLIVALLHVDDTPTIMAAIALAGLMGWIYQQIPDDLNLEATQAQPESQQVFQYLRGNQGILSLDDDLDSEIVGYKAGRLAQIKRWGYSVPKGWILLPFDDPQELVDVLQPSELSPLVVRSSAVGEDLEYASAAGQYETVLNVTNKQELIEAVQIVRGSYEAPHAVQYRGDHNIKEAGMGVLIQQQVQSVYSGVAFSRDPITQETDAVVIEALPGSASAVVSGRFTPEQYRAFVVDAENFSSIQLEGTGQIPPGLIKQVAYLTRRIEERYYGIPQDIEWSYDGQTLWVLQVRPISTMLPIWTRKIAAEVIPGVISPLTWSINRPLTCGVWGGLFALVLGERSLGLDFNNTATLFYSRAYFNASLLGEVFLRMGLPPESLEFLTKGAKMSKPPFSSTLQNAPGLLKLIFRELFLARDFRWENRKWFTPGLSQLHQELVEDLEPSRLLARIDYIMELLRRATYYSILAPLSVALRQGIFRVKDGEVDNSMTPEVAALRELQELVQAAKEILPESDPQDVFEELDLSEAGKAILVRFDQFIQRYGYLSEVGTDIAVATWKEEPEVIKQLFIQLMHGSEATANQSSKKNKRFVQKRVDLKGKVTEIYSQLLAELRWCFLALEQQWLKSGLLRQTGDIFFLEFDEVRRVIQAADSQLIYQIPELVELRRSLLAEDAEISRIPVLVYGNTPPVLVSSPPIFLSPDQVLQGIPTSPGQAQGRVKVLRSLRDVLEVDKNTILVVPYTDSGWAPLLVKAGGLIAESGGRLSHGAILAREYGIPAIMDVKSATWVLQDGQRVRMDGSRGIIEISNDLRPM